jgi:hypothetical protein
VERPSRLDQLDEPPREVDDGGRLVAQEARSPSLVSGQRQPGVSPPPWEQDGCRQRHSAPARRLVGSRGLGAQCGWWFALFLFGWAWRSTQAFSHNRRPTMVTMRRGAMRADSRGMTARPRSACRPTAKCRPGADDGHGLAAYRRWHTNRRPKGGRR